MVIVCKQDDDNRTANFVKQIFGAWENFFRKFPHIDEFGKKCCIEEQNLRITVSGSNVDTFRNTE